MYARCTLLAATLSYEEKEFNIQNVDHSTDLSHKKLDSIQRCIKYLQDSEFISHTTHTTLGQHCTCIHTI